MLGVGIVSLLFSSAAYVVPFQLQDSSNTKEKDTSRIYNAINDPTLLEINYTKKTAETSDFVTRL